MASGRGWSARHSRTWLGLGLGLGLGFAFGFGFGLRRGIGEPAQLGALLVAPLPARRGGVDRDGG